MPLSVEVYAARPNQSMHVGILEKSPEKKWWHMPGPSSIGWRKLICLLGGGPHLLADECEGVEGGGKVVPLILQ